MCDLELVKRKARRCSLRRSWTESGRTQAGGSPGPVVLCPSGSVWVLACTSRCGGWSGLKLGSGDSFFPNLLGFSMLLSVPQSGLVLPPSGNSLVAVLYIYIYIIYKYISKSGLVCPPLTTPEGHSLHVSHSLACVPAFWQVLRSKRDIVLPVSAFWQILNSYSFVWGLRWCTLFFK